MKKMLLLFSFLIMLTLVACNTTTTTEVASQEAQWKIVVEGVKEGEAELNNIDYAKMESVEIEATLRKKDGSEERQQWKGVPLKAVLEFFEVKEYKEVVVEAADGYAKEYTVQLVEREGTILGSEVNGQPLDEETGPLQLIPQGEPGNMWIKNVAKIKAIQ